MIQGFIDFLDERQTSFGTMYDIKVNGTKYGVGKFKPKGIERGDYVQFEEEQRGKYFNVKSGTLRKLDKPAGVSKSGGVQPQAGGGMSFDDRQTVISKQAAVNTALTFVKLLSDNGAIPMPTKVAADKKADLIEKIVFDYAAKFYQFSTGNELDLPDTSASDLAAVEEAGAWTE